MDLIGRVLGRLAMIAAGGLVLYLGFVIVNGTVSAVSVPGADPDEENRKAAQQLFEQGRQIFRFDTFGDESFWGDALQLHQAINGAKLGGVGPGLSPNAALGLGLKIDLDLLAPALANQLRNGKINLDDPAT